eukprot:m.183131 g.183131  ORF g.183131 m.183131 type:complete len:77 (+) comp13592_c0_seq10:4476-4706(+)
MLVLTTECNMQLHLKEGLPVSLKVKDEGKVKFTPTIVRCAPFYQVRFRFRASSVVEEHVRKPVIHLEGTTLSSSSR